MTRAEMLDVLKKLLGGPEPSTLKIEVESVTEDTRIDKLGLDSIAILDFIYDVEDRFQIQTEIGDLVAMERVGDLIDYVEAKRAG